MQRDRLDMYIIDYNPIHMQTHIYSYVYMQMHIYEPINHK